MITEIWAEGAMLTLFVKAITEDSCGGSLTASGTVYFGGRALSESNMIFMVAVSHGAGGS